MPGTDAAPDVHPGRERAAEGIEFPSGTIAAAGHPVCTGLAFCGTDRARVVVPAGAYPSKYAGDAHVRRRSASIHGRSRTDFGRNAAVYGGGAVVSAVDLGDAAMLRGDAAPDERAAAFYECDAAIYGSDTDAVVGSGTGTAESMEEAMKKIEARTEETMEVCFQDPRPWTLDPGP
eukprot:2798783-Rhodomonas_salina.2